VSDNKTGIRDGLVEMERVFSRRAFFMNIAKTVGVAAAFDKFGPDAFAQATFTPEDVVSEFGRMIIPVDQDPGWATFDPGITNYALNVYMRQVFSMGNDLAYAGLRYAITAFNTLPVNIGYGPQFLKMPAAARGQYFQNVLTGAFENDGVQDILLFGGVFMMLGVKQTFYMNYPNHLPNPNLEFQIVPTTGPKTGWQQMKFAGPVGPEEEKQLRDKYFNAVEVFGVDLRNPYI